MRFISLFSGIGGLDLGLERAGMTCIAQVEIDDYASKVLAKHWPSVIRFRDVRDCGAHNLPPADLICGGFPCQDISYAGKGAGLSGARSGLWYEFARIICEVRPRYVLVENVAALLTRGLSDVLSTLASFGYDAEWQCLPAVAFGAPHRRDRLFIVAYTSGTRAGMEVHRNSGQTREHAQSLQPEILRQENGATSAEGTYTDSADVSDAQCFRCEEMVKSVFGGTENKRPADQIEHCRISTGRGWWEVEPAVGRVADGFPARVDRLRGLGNAVVPQVAQFIGECIMDYDRNI